MNNTGRPLSPHLTIYRWPITMALSILHRMTGIALALGLIVLTLWFMHIAAGPEQYQYFRATMGTTFGKLLLIGWTFAFFLHLANGIRHLVWDTGRGLEKRQANASAWFAIVFALTATVIFWVVRL